ncbi:MAG: hypothetical protein QUV35_13985 [Hydrogenophaga sp.]|uniref:hypothetical protein n=1 Tax=Hydrogenophaga sp. TaxID=1904254 RepID=UPI002609FD43|nr:hypothetical protein [Hydrogenophaga sp.]MDM7943730.1 hypothetical protein [Hydrogenophaga sp.]
MSRNLEKDNEVGLLDLLILVAENFKLLIIGSVLAGLIAAGLAYLAPKRFVSHAILALPSQVHGLSHVYDVIKIQTPPQVAELITAPSVLDPVIVSLKLAQGHTLATARNKLLSQLRVAAHPDGLVHLHVTSQTPEQAQAVANAILESWLKSTVPGVEEQAALKKMLAHAESSLSASRRLIERLSPEHDVSPGNTLKPDDGAAMLIAAADLQTRYLHETTEIASLLRGYSNDVVKQVPTLPSGPEAMPKGLIALLSALAAAMMLLLWILIVQAWRSAEQDPAIAPKLLRLRAALGMKHPPTNGIQLRADHSNDQL